MMLYIVMGTACVLAWSLIGFLGFLFAVAGDMRGKQYDHWYYKNIGECAIIMGIAGPIGFIVGIIMGISGAVSRRDFGKSIHKIVNIGSKNKDELFD